MGKQYFISPNYTCKYTNDGGMFQKNTPIEYDVRDTLTNWLVDNSIYFPSGGVSGGNGGQEHGDRRLFNGLDGVLCEIKETTVRESKKNLARGAVEMQVYHRIVLIKYMPKEKKIPKELTDKLKKLKYRASSSKKDPKLLAEADWRLKHF
ncbi:MAG: hypothetical protein WC475_04520 [Candidatus Paceibacterota bacterium]